MTSKTCPNRESLRQLLLGQLSDDRAAELEEHLEQCGDCSVAAETISASDDVTDAIGSPDRVHCDDGDEELIGQAIERAKQLGAQNETVETQEPVRVKLAQSESEAVAPGGNAASDQEISFLAPAQQPNEIGRLGGYRILEVLGVGGMGIVIRAEDPKLERQVALKAMKPAVAASRSAKDRFLREAKSTAAIEHDHIVPIYQVGEDGDVPFIAMQFLRGESLKTRLERDKRIEQREVLRLARELAVGLAAAHDRGLIHRDIKPDNIWLESREDPESSDETDASFRVKILDFGLVRSVSDDADLTQSGVVVGTPRYMAPEQAQGQQVDHRADLFSLGSVLYHLVAGRAPFGGSSLTATLMAVAHEDPEPIETLCPVLHQGLAGLIMRLLAKGPDERPQTAGDLVRLIDEIETELDEQAQLGELAHTAAYEPPAAQSGEQPAANAPTRLATPAPSTPGSGGRRRRSLIAGALGAAVVLLGVIVIVTGKGTVTVSIPDRMHDDVEVRIWGERDVVAVLDKQNRWKIRLRAGEYTLDVKGGRDQFRLKNKRLTLSRFGKTIVQMDYIPAVASRDSNQSPKKQERETYRTSGWQGWPPDAPPPAIAPFDAEQAKEHQEAWAKYLGVPVEIENSIGMKFRLIPPGEFMMGSTEEEIDELLIGEVTEKYNRVVRAGGPQHRVTVTQPFFLGSHEVTQNQFNAFVKETGYKTETETDEQGGQGVLPIDGQSRRGFPSGFSGANLVDEQTNDTPVVNVCWNDAVAFCEWYSKQQDGAVFALPTEAQWEYACRAGTTTLWHCGDSEGALQEYGWFGVNSGKKLHPVGQLRPNAFGLYDMHGNVWEWCSDFYAEDYYATSPSVDPKGRPAGWNRVLRGGGFGNSASACRSARRRNHGPGAREDGLGFRVAASIDAVEKMLAPPPRTYVLSFDDGGDGVEIPTLKYDGSHPITLEAWATASQTIESGHRNIVTNLSGSYASATQAGIALQQRFREGDGYSSWGGWVATPGGPGRHLIPFAPREAFHPRRRTHLALVVESERVQLYVAGKLVRVQSSNRPHRPSSAPFGLATSWAGRLDEVRISKTARYTEDFVPKERFEADGHALALYHFDEGSGTVLKDSSGNGHHGIIHGATWVRADGWPTDAPPPAVAPFDAEQAKRHQQAWAKYLGVPVEYENSIGMKLVLIPPGEFMMGSTDEQVEELVRRFKRENNPNPRKLLEASRPQHRVRITKPFYYGAHEVRVADFARFVAATGYKSEGETDRTGGQGVDDEADSQQRLSWRAPGFDQADSQPVVRLSWNDAASFCEWLSGQEDESYRLPTEAEWEYSCRAGSTTNWFFGSDEAELERYAWYGKKGGAATKSVGLRLPNPFGLFDVYGNADEWCSDWYGQDYYRVSPVDDPTGPSSGTQRVQRGSNFAYWSVGARSGVRDAGTRSGPAYGFRIVRTIDVPKAAAKTVEQTRIEPTRAFKQSSWQPGPTGNVLPGLIPRPAKLPGVGRWQVETALPRSRVNTIAWSPDGKLIACGTAAGNIRLYDAASLRLVRFIAGHWNQVNCVAWSPDGQWLCSVGRDSSARLWHGDGRPGPVCEGHVNSVFWVAWSPDGQQFATTGSDGTVRLWETDGKDGPVLDAKAGQVLCVDWSSDGKVLASAHGDGTVRLWSSDGRPKSVLEGHQEPVYRVSLSRDNRLASTDRLSTLRYWTPEGAPGDVLEERGQYVAWSPGGEQVAAVGWLDGVRVVTENRDMLWKSPSAASPEVHGVAWSPDGRRLATLHGYQAIRVWNAQDGTLAAQLESQHAYWNPVAWSRTGDRLAAGGKGNTARLWNGDGTSVETLEGHTDQVTSVAWSPAGDRLATGADDRTVRIWELDGSPGPSLTGHADVVTCIGWSHDGKRLASGSSDKKVRLWRADGTPQLILPGHENNVYSVAWSNEDRWIASASWDQTVRLWKPDGAPGPVLEGFESRVWGVSWSPTAPLLASISENLRLWNEDGSPGAVMKGPWPYQSSVCWSPDGRWIAANGRRPSSQVELWRPDGRRGPAISTPQPVTSVAWRPGSRQVAYGDVASAIGVIDTESGQHRWRAVLLDDGESVSFTPAGEILHGDPATIENELVYLIETKDKTKTLEILKPSEFQKRIGAPSKKAAVIHRVGPGEGMLPTLAAALEKAKGGEIIEIHTNEPLIVEPNTLTWSKSGELTIRAGKGYRPIVACQRGEAGDLIGFWQTSDSTKVILEDLTFVDVFQRTGGAHRVIHVNCPLVVRRCVIVANAHAIAPNLGQPNDASRTPELVVEGCYFATVLDPYNGVSGAAVLQAVLRNNLFVANKKVFVTARWNVPQERLTADFQNNTCIASASLFVAANLPMAIATQRNLFYRVGEPGRVLSNRPIDLSTAHERIRYEGKDNLFYDLIRGKTGELSDGFAFHYDTWLDGPKPFERDALQIDPQFAHPELVKLAGERVLPPRAFELKPTSPALKAGIGTDLSRIPELPPQLHKVLPPELLPPEEVARK